jgi:hypothetical protein
MVEPVEVFAAIEAGDEVRRLLDGSDLSDAATHTWVRYEVTMLSHWAIAARDHPGGYVALGEGLAAFAESCEQMLANHR